MLSRKRRTPGDISVRRSDWQDDRDAKRQKIGGITLSGVKRNRSDWQDDRDITECPKVQRVGGGAPDRVTFTIGSEERRPSRSPGVALAGFFNTKAADVQRRIEIERKRARDFADDHVSKRQRVRSEWEKVASGPWKDPPTRPVQSLMHALSGWSSGVTFGVPSNPSVGVGTDPSVVIPMSSWNTVRTQATGGTQTTPAAQATGTQAVPPLPGNSIVVPTAGLLNIPSRPAPRNTRYRPRTKPRLNKGEGTGEEFWGLRLPAVEVNRPYTLAAVTLALVALYS